MGGGKWEESHREDLGCDSYDYVREGWSLGKDGRSGPGVRRKLLHLPRRNLEFGFRVPQLQIMYDTEDCVKLHPANGSGRFEGFSHLQNRARLPALGSGFNINIQHRRTTFKLVD